MRWQNMAGQRQGCEGLLVAGKCPAMGDKRNGAEVPY